MNSHRSTIQCAFVLTVMPAVASLMGLQLECAQPRVTVSIPLPEVRLFVTVGPPPIPEYEQPEAPDEGYAWTPGYWAWGDDGYFWVPGTWVIVPAVGLLWTPGYWGWGNDAYEFHHGYWAHHVGFYGGINYGHGYEGSGYEGGRWEGEHYRYNRSVTNVGSDNHITNVYNQTVIINNNNHVAYSGGAGGLKTGPTPQEQAVGREQHVAPTAEQNHQHQSASQNRELLASANRGKPPVAATAKPADFSPRSIVPAKASGGPVDEATLKATPRTLAPAANIHGAEVKPAGTAPRPVPLTAASPSTSIPIQHPAPPVISQPQAPLPRPNPAHVSSAPVPPPPAIARKSESVNVNKAVPAHVPEPSVNPVEHPTPRNGPAPTPPPDQKPSGKPGSPNPNDPNHPKKPAFIPPPEPHS